MRRRITFVHGAEDEFDPRQAQLNNDTLSISSVKGAREDRITLGSQQLPQEIWRVLNQCHELHIRWASSVSYPSTIPFVSRVSPGLHVFFTPYKTQSAQTLCPILRKVFGDQTKCQNPEDTFSRISLVSERFASSSAWQYHSALPSLVELVTYIEHKICPPRHQKCHSEANSLASASYLDIDYDTISQVVVLSSFWPEPPNSPTWNEQIQNSEGADQVEVGVLANERATQPEELTLGGFLTVVGEDDEPKPTLFSFPSRHHPLAHPARDTYSTSILPPSGLHPTLRLSFTHTAATPPAATCALHAYLTLPSALFADKYQLSDPLLLASHNLHAIRALSGETDLEAPDWAVAKWGSSLLVELAPPPPITAHSSKRQTWHADVPLHLRYLPPAAGGLADVEVPWPVVFWACTADEGTKMSVNPFDRVNLGYDGLFGPRTMFYHLQPRAAGNGSLVEVVPVPVLDARRTGWVEVGTVAVVVAGFLWVCWKVVGVFRLGGWAASAGVEERAQEKKES